VHTIPPVKKENITLNAGTHNVIPVLAPQGAMVVRYTSASKIYSPVMYPVIVRKSGGRETINVQQLNAKEKYLVGKYDLEVLSEPRLVIENVEVGQSSTTTIEIPEPGVLRLEKQGGEMTVSLFSKTSQQTQWVKNIKDEASKLMMNLMPGEYMIVAKGKNSSQMQKTIVQEVKIESNKTTNVVLSLKK
ncbi:MAG: hypothetical protein IJ250_06570, partial [Bacteroidales bacterium]|nr:hypothetical protein [Bacteroidales bacterium]